MAEHQARGTQPIGVSKRKYRGCWSTITKLFKDLSCVQVRRTERVDNEPAKCAENSSDEEQCEDREESITPEISNGSTTPQPEQFNESVQDRQQQVVLDTSHTAKDPVLPAETSDGRVFAYSKRYNILPEDEVDIRASRTTTYQAADDINGRVLACSKKYSIFTEDGVNLRASRSITDQAADGSYSLHSNVVRASPHPAAVSQSTSDLNTSPPLAAVPHHTLDTYSHPAAVSQSIIDNGPITPAPKSRNSGTRRRRAKAAAKARN